ncbi:vitamin D-binding protein [Trichomycterus rosablanca]|uniref:vitamin D-binding protein n=1 Tax=Trichomycterus rosablanca TaxID=2290929 RepID=UPI002F351BDA
MDGELQRLQEQVGQLQAENERLALTQNGGTGDNVRENGIKPAWWEQKYQQRGFAIFLRFLSNVCNNQVNLKSYRTGLAAYFGGLLRVPFTEAQGLSMHFQSGLAKCCSQPEYLFQFGVKHTSVSLPVLTTILFKIRCVVEACCSGTDDATACLKEKESKLEKMATLLSKMDSFCSHYFKLELPTFKIMVQQEFQGKEAKHQAWLDLTTSCCSQNSPAQICQKLTKVVIKHEDDATA